MNMYLTRLTCIAVALFTAACASTSDSRDPYLGNSERRGFVGGIMLAEGGAAPESPKVIVASYALNGTTLTPQEAVVAYGAGGATTSVGDDFDFKIELIGADDRIMQSYQVTDPRKFVVEQQGIVENPTGVLTTRFKFEPTATRVRIRDRSSAIVAETDVRALLVEFCRRSKEDRDCRNVR